jgi:F-box-like
MPPACVAFDPGTPPFFPTPAKYDFDDSHFMDSKKFAVAMFSAQFHHQNDQLMTPPASPRPIQPSSPFDQVPNEILDHIIGLIHTDTRRDIYAVLKDISACCLVSRQFYAVAVTWLYRHVPISDPYAFTKVCYIRLSLPLRM